jgi:hypothetical protein
MLLLTSCSKKQVHIVEELADEVIEDISEYADGDVSEELSADVLEERYGQQDY